MSLFRSTPILFFALILSLSSCKSIKPEKPVEAYFEKSFEKPSSWINIPVEFSVEAFENQVNKEIRGLIYQDTSLTDNGHDGLMYKIWKKDNIKISFKDDYFYFDVPLKIWAKAGFKAETFGIDLSQSKETDMELNVKFKSLLGISRNWKVTPVTSPAGHQWIKKPVIKIGFFEISLTPILDQILENQHAIIAKELDKEIQKRVEIIPYIQKAWVEIQRPIELSHKMNSWLKISPSEIMMTPFKVVDGKIMSNIGIKGYVETFIGKKPDEQANNHLPLLETISKIQDHYQIALMGEISHGFAKKLLEENLVGQTYTFRNGKRRVSITGIDVFGSNGKLVVKCMIDGSAKGEIYLKGNPVFDQSSSSLIVNNLEYDINTKNALIKAADWMNHGNFLNTIEKNLKFPLGKEIEESKRLIRQNLNNHRVSNNIILNGSLENLIPGEVIITKESIKTMVTAEGQIQVKIEGLL